MPGEDRFSSHPPDETTAIVDVAELRRRARQSEKNRHMLVRMDGSNVGHVASLRDGAPVSLGRHTECDVWLDDDGISRRHARVFFENGAAFIEDTGSANGTFVRGQRVERHRLEDGDVIQLGPNVVFRYSVTDSDEENMLRQLYEASVRDPLTGAYNREHFEERLKAEVAYARRHRTQVSLVLFDLDHFKSINDAHGHPAGDLVLIEVVSLVHKGLRAEDVFARYGGEEFAVILRGIDVHGAAKVGERMREHVVTLSVEYENERIPVTISVGCASLAEAPNDNVQAIVAIADRRLYAAKRAGRNRVVAED